VGEARGRARQVERAGRGIAGAELRERQVDEPAPAGESSNASSTGETPPAQECTLSPDDEFLGLDLTRRIIFSGVCHSIRWMDSLFGEEQGRKPIEVMEGRLSFNFERRQGGARVLQPTLHIRARLPNLSRRFELFFDRENENKSIVGERNNPALDQLAQEGQETTQAGVDYELRRTVESLLNFRLGVRANLLKRQFDPFVRSRYTLDFARSETRQWRFSQTLFWRNQEGFGETSTLDFESHLGGPYVFRWGNTATVSEITDAFRWGSTVSVLRGLGDNKAILASYSAGGETGKEERVSNFGPRLSYRQELNRKWLFGEVYTGIDHLKPLAEVSRRRESYVGAKLEAMFRGL